MSRRKSPRASPLWAEARKLYGLRERDITKAKDLGLNPQDFKKHAALDTEKVWKKPLRQYIAIRYVLVQPDIE